MMRAAWGLLLVVSIASACANAEPRGPRAGATRYEANATVLDDGDGPELCLGAVADSLPPQCGGMPIRGWRWEDVDGEDTVGGTTWGEYHVVGSYDGSSFTVEDAGPMVAVGPEEGDPFHTPCPEPSGGWTDVDPSATGD